MPIVKSKARTKRKPSEAELLDEATLRPMRAIKEKAAHSGRKLKKQELLKQGYNERFVAKLAKA